MKREKNPLNSQSELLIMIFLYAPVCARPKPNKTRQGQCIICEPRLPVGRYMGIFLLASEELQTKTDFRKCSHVRCSAIMFLQIAIRPNCTR